MENNEIKTDNSITIEFLLKSSFKIFLDNIVVCIANTIIAFLSTVILLFTVVGIIALPAVWGGYIESMIRLSTSQKVEIGDFFKAGFNRWSTLWVGYMATCFGIAIGYLFFIIPGIYLMVRWYFTIQIIMNENLDAMKAMTKSGKMTSNIMWEVLVVLIVCIIIRGIGVIIPFLPLVTTPLSVIIVAKYYSLNLDTKNYNI